MAGAFLAHKQEFAARGRVVGLGVIAVINNGFFIRGRGDRGNARKFMWFAGARGEPEQKGRIDAKL